MFSITRIATGRRKEGARSPSVTRVLLMLVQIVAAGFILNGANAWAETPTAETPKSWSPPVPNATDSDWIQLNTHEWLRGKIKGIREESVVFDSKKLDELEFDWRDVRLLVTAREHTFRFRGNIVVVGTAEMRDDVIRIRVKDKVREFPRADLVSMVPSGGSELQRWGVDLGLSIGGQAGNTEQLSFSTMLSIDRTTNFQHTGVDYLGNVATQQRDVSANNHRVTASHDIYITRKFFAQVARFEFYQDDFQNIAWRVTPTTGLGYNVFLDSKVKWQIVGGAGFQAIRHDSVTSGNDRSNDFPVILLTHVDVDLPNRYEWETSYQLQLITTRLENTNQHLVSTFSFNLWSPLDFETTFQWDWIAEPSEDSSSTRPKSSDYRITVGLSLSL